MIPSVPAPATFDWECGTTDADMQKLLALLPAPDVARDELVGLGLDLGGSVTSSADTWSWTGTEVTV